jgi:hypothetical protein
VVGIKERTIPTVTRTETKVAEAINLVINNWIKFLLRRWVEGASDIPALPDCAVALILYPSSL